MGELHVYESGHMVHFVETFLGVFIGAVTFTGSIVAFLKLQGSIGGNPLVLLPGNGRHMLNLGAISTIFLFQILFCIYWDSFSFRLFLLVSNALISFFIGWHLVMAIGGADMPVVVSMLNSYSGWATSAAGFMLNNDAMIVTGALVGSSGAILSYIMCTAMNRGFISVILGGFGGESTTPAVSPSPAAGAAADAKAAEQRPVQPIQCHDVAEVLMNAKNIVIIPGYGLAVARAQHCVAEMTDILRKLGKRVVFAIHPVAGRLPGHMNVLLAEANVPYNIVLEMDEVNPEMEDVDVSIVMGANDIVNPIALTDPKCPIAGMPIIECYRSKLVIVNKRSMASGYSGIDNPLFYYENTRMYFGDAKKAFEELLTEVRAMAGSIEADKKSVASGEKKALLKEDALPKDLPPVQQVLGVIKETTPLERMVALSPSTCLALRKRGYGIVIESTAGDLSAFPDYLYERSGCQIVKSAAEVLAVAKIIMKVKPPTPEEAKLFKEGHTLISFVYPATNSALVEQLREKGVNVLAMDMVPRTSKAQKLDALSSLSNLAGYRAVIESSHRMGRVFTGQITAAGKMPPCKVFIIGAGVAGLAAIGTAKSLGAIVQAFDTRKSVKEQIESMGGEFVPCPCEEDAEDANGYAKPISAEYLKAELGLFADTAPNVDVIISTAAIPGRKAPVLISEEMVSSMRPGSCIVDLAAATGGNCALTKPGETINYKGVWIIGDTDLISRMSTQASSLYSQNIFNLVDMLGKKAEEFSIRVEDETVRQMVICKAKELLYPPPKMAVSAAPIRKKAEAVASKPSSGHGHKSDEGWGSGMVSNMLILGAFLLSLVFFVPYSFITHFMDFVLAVIVGYHVIWSVTPALHTPLMAVTNAISGIIVVGGMLELSSPLNFSMNALLGALATMLATVNIFGGFFVTHRMIEMFH